MNNIYLIGGTMGVGKTAVCQNLNTKKIDTSGKTIDQIAKEIIMV